MNHPWNDTDNQSVNFPNRAVIRASIKLLYKRLSRETMQSFADSLSATEELLPRNSDGLVVARHLANKITRHLRLPEGCIHIRFQEMDNPGYVELGSNCPYQVTLNSKYRNDKHRIAAILAHEITHVFLHRRGIRFGDEFENEILTDTTSTYLGVGWLTLNAIRVTMDQYTSGDASYRHTKTEWPGYLTLGEFGYVLAKRSIALGNRAYNIQSDEGRDVAQTGFRLAIREARNAPLSSCDRFRFIRYCWDRHWRQGKGAAAKNLMAQIARRTYQFESGKTSNVVFECPICFQLLRLPTSQRLQANCPNCATILLCRT